MTPEQLERLLYEEEGTTLDFKRAEYVILKEQGGSWEDGRAKIIKDLLAFANANRREDAYIVLGTTKVPGERAQIIGIAQEIDDAKVQQIVNSKLNRPIAFTYRHVTHDNKRLVVIHVPVRQERPHFVRNGDARLPGGVVYVRRGSSTAIASPDEVHAMGRLDAGFHASPSIAVALFILRTRWTSRSRPPRSFTILSCSRATSSTLQQRA
jgi:predicted HTH transcriptional regulator